MCVSRAWFGVWVVDSAWSGQRARVCETWPALAELFERCAGREIASVHSKPIKKKRRKSRNKRIVIPRRGIWFVFARWLSRWRYDEIRDLRHATGLAPLRVAMLATHLMLCCGWKGPVTVSERPVVGSSDDVVRIAITFASHPLVTMHFDVGTCSHVLHVYALVGQQHTMYYSHEIYQLCAIIEPWRDWVRGRPHRAAEWTRLRASFWAILQNEAKG